MAACTRAPAEEGGGRVAGSAAPATGGWVAGLFRASAADGAAAGAANGDARGPAGADAAAAAAAAAAVAPPFDGVAAAGAGTAGAPFSAVEQLAIASGLWLAVWVANNGCVAGGGPGAARDGDVGAGAAAAGWEHLLPPPGVAALKAVEDLDFGGGDDADWVALLERLLGLLSAAAAAAAAAPPGTGGGTGTGTAAAAAAVPPALTVRVLHVVRALCAGGRLPAAVKTAALPAELRALTPLAAPPPPAGGVASSASARTLLVALRAGLGPAAPAALLLSAIFFPGAVGHAPPGDCRLRRIARTHTMMPTHSGAEPLPKVEKLNAVNHLAWFANMEHMLKLKNCWAAVDEDAPPRVVRIMQKEERIMQKEERIPSRAELGAVIAGNPTTKAGKAAKPKARAQLATLDRQRMDEVAMATMHLYVEPVHHVAFRVCTTAREAWGKLQVASAPRAWQWP
ncbi:hypothetical protein I4F81_005073 [Pyropia yezoensis]|uniref:Uncharacterized protein n=1 Tax=Pyropia yezoensis TaxID=2788 RepID=A0ACC3BXN1_PYRYE|nr:hypothetical protein I4F81_005073 [Neopyropia yezoensis]